MGSAPSRHKKIASKVTIVNSLISRRQEVDSQTDTNTHTALIECSPSRSLGTADELHNGELSVMRQAPRPSLTGEGRSVENIRENLSQLIEEGEQFGTPCVPYLECRQCREHTGFLLYSCRVCDHAYHTACLKAAGNLQTAEEEKRMLTLCSSRCGWSCHICENLSLHLTEDEMHTIMDSFDQYDVNSDSSISKEEFLNITAAIYEKRFGVTLSQQDMEVEEMKFTIIDKDRTNCIDWWEFLTYEALSILSKRPKRCLVKLLTVLEVKNLKSVFSKFDKDGGGSITSDEAEQVYLEWYQTYLVNDDSPLLETVVISQKVDDIMSCDTDENGAVDWAEFLAHQAIFALGARPNSTKCHVLNRLKHRSIKRKTSLAQRPFS